MQITQHAAGVSSWTIMHLYFVWYTSEGLAENAPMLRLNLAYTDRT